MRIAVLVNSFSPPALGGAARVAALQVDALKAEGHEVRVWSSATPFTRMHLLARLWFHLVTDARPRADIVQEVVAWKPDALYTHNVTGCGFATPRAMQAHGIPWTHTLHDIQLTDPSGQETVEWSRTWIARLWRGFWSARRRACFGTPDVLLSPTAWLLDWHRRHGFHGAEERVVRNPIEGGELRDRVLSVPATVVYVGRLSHDKGFDRFLEIVTQLPSSLVDQITVVGSGPLAAYAKRLADARMDLVGALPPDAVRRVLMDADLLIAPSRLLENQQMILLEALSVGTPVVATDTGGTRETLEGTGCPVVAPDDLLAEVMRLLSDPEAWKNISRKMSHGV